MARFRLPNPWVNNDPRAVQQNFDGIQDYLNELAAPVPEVTSLPASPYNRQVVDYVADATNGVVWRLRYRATSGSAYKWEFIGGTPLHSIQTNATTRATSTYGDVASGAAPVFTLALAGDYLIEVGSNMAPGSTGNGMFASFSVAGATALDSDAALVYLSTAPVGGQLGVVNLSKKTGLAAGTTIQQKWKMQGSVAGSVDRRWITIRPVRVG